MATESKSIAIFSAQYPPHMGGIESFTQNMARALATLGHKVLVVTNDTEGLDTGLTREGDVEIMRLPCHPLVSGRLPLPLNNGRRRALLRELGSRRFDGVLVNARFYPHSLLGMKVARSQGLDPVVLDHGSAWLSFSNPVLDPIVRLYERAFTAYGKLRYKPRYYGISKKSSEWLGTFGIKSCGEITNSIDAPEYREQASDRDFKAELGLPDDAFVVAFVGRFIPEKGISSILEASRSEELRSRGVVFLLAGDGPLAPEVESARGASLKWLGRLGRPDVSALLQQADALCLPTRSEGFSTTLLEASACGCPSVVTDVGGAKELIPSEEYGTIIASMDARELIRTLSRLADNREVAASQGEKCRDWVERSCCWRSSAQSLVEAFWRMPAEVE